MRHLFLARRGTRLRLTLFWVAVFVFRVAPAVFAQSPVTSPPSPPLVFTYNDAQGQGRLTLSESGPDESTGGRFVKVSLTQNAYSYTGSGVSLPLEDSSPFRTLLSFTLVSVRSGVSFHFTGTIISGITVSADGTYHRAGVPERRSRWNIVLGAGGGGLVGPSAIKGVAMAGPIFPVERPGVPNMQPLPRAIITVQPAGGGPEITRVTADENGRFQIPIAPGTYLIVPLPPQPGAVLPRGIPQTVTVKAGGFTEVVIEYDTGIR